MAKPFRLFTFIIGAACTLGGCGKTETGPMRVSAIGTPPRIVNPNLQSLDPPSAFLIEATAQGLVRFDAAGEIEPALAQSWIVSDDGLRYTFRIRRTSWLDGGPVTAEQVAARLRAAISRASRSPFKPVLGAMQDAVAMTDQVLEVGLAGPRPNLLQLFAQPEMAILVQGMGTGPYALANGQSGTVSLRARIDDEEGEDPELPEIQLRGENAARAVARFALNESDLVIGGTIGTLRIARASGQANNRLVFDPVAGLFGLAFASAEGPLADPAVRDALSMAVDRDGLVATMGAPGLQPRLTLLPPVADELRRPAAPEWAAQPLPMRRERASRTMSTLDQPLRLRVAMPNEAGYRLVFAHLRRDWRMIGVEAVRVEAGSPAEIRLVDSVAPAMLASWYLRHFTCVASPVCSPDADLALEAARRAPSPGERRAQLARADQLLSALTPFIPLTSPVRWSLVSPRLTGFRPNPFARHPAGTLIAQDS